VGWLPEFDSQQGQGFFSSQLCPDQLWGPLSFLSIGYWGLFPLGKGLSHEADQSPLSIAEVKNVWSYTPTPPYIFNVWCLVKHRATCLSHLY